jgi:hypothetical protein
MSRVAFRCKNSVTSMIRGTESVDMDMAAHLSSAKKKKGNGRDGRQEDGPGNEYVRSERPREASFRINMRMVHFSGL